VQVAPLNTSVPVQAKTLLEIVATGCFGGMQNRPVVSSVNVGSVQKWVKKLKIPSTVGG
jgi:hypothetical protein